MQKHRVGNPNLEQDQEVRKNKLESTETLQWKTSAAMNPIKY